MRAANLTWRSRVGWGRTPMQAWGIQLGMFGKLTRSFEKASGYNPRRHSAVAPLVACPGRPARLFSLHSQVAGRTPNSGFRGAWVPQPSPRCWPGLSLHTAQALGTLPLFLALISMARQMEMGHRRGIFYLPQINLATRPHPLLRVPGNAFPRDTTGTPLPR